MKLEGEYLWSLLAGATYSDDILSRYSMDVLERAESMNAISLWKEQEMQPNLGDDTINIDYKKYTLERMSNTSSSRLLF